MSARSMDAGFSKASSSNLPVLTLDMALSFVSTSGLFSSAEMRGVKAARSSRSSYADDAVGYVNLRRTGDLCIVRGRITPEHRVREKPYRVQAKIDERDGVVCSCKCYDCVASAGGCKHAIAFLFWLYRRSEEKSPTEVACYWKKSNLSRVGTDVKFVAAKDLVKKKSAGVSPVPSPVNFLGQLRDRVEREGLRMPMSALMHSAPSTESFSARVDLALDLFIRCCMSSKELPCPQKFLDYFRSIDSSDWVNVQHFTSGQSTNPKWFHYRFGRITGSRCYEAANCKTLDGSLRESILGSRTFKGNNATRRGISLEPKVLQTVQQTCSIQLDASLGLFLRKDLPIFGASPDGLSLDGNLVVEVKCPTSSDAFKRYVVKGEIQQKFRVQLQMEMYFTGATRGLFVVADPAFETTNNITVIEDKIDYEYLQPFLERAEKFWVDSIFAELVAHRKQL